MAALLLFVCGTVMQLRMYRCGCCVVRETDLLALLVADEHFLITRIQRQLGSGRAFAHKKILLW